MIADIVCHAWMQGHSRVTIEVVEEEEIITSSPLPGGGVCLIGLHEDQSGGLGEATNIVPACGDAMAQQSDDRPFSNFR